MEATKTWMAHGSGFSFPALLRLCTTHSLCLGGILSQTKFISCMVTRFCPHLICCTTNKLPQADCPEDAQHLRPGTYLWTPVQLLEGLTDLLAPLWLFHLELSSWFWCQIHRFLDSGTFSYPPAAYSCPGRLTSGSMRPLLGLPEDISTEAHFILWDIWKTSAEEGHSGLWPLHGLFPGWDPCRIWDRHMAACVAPQYLVRWNRQCTKHEGSAIPCFTLLGSSVDLDR
jgi:hypothetical protein